MALNRQVYHIHALVLHKKDINQRHRRVLMSSDTIPFFWAKVYGAAHSSRLSSVTSPFTLIQAKVIGSSYGWQIEDCHGIEFFSHINENLDYFHMVCTWVKHLIKTSGAGDDNRLFNSILPLMQATHQERNIDMLDVLFYTRFLYLQGLLPEFVKGHPSSTLLHHNIVHYENLSFNWPVLKTELKDYVKKNNF